MIFEGILIKILENFLKIFSEFNRTMPQNESVTYTIRQFLFFKHIQVNDKDGSSLD